MDRKKMGKAGRAAGKRFEVKVRKDLEKKGWIVFRNSNDVEFFQDMQPFDSHVSPVKGKFSQAKTKWNPFTKMPMSLQSGFPDFVVLINLKSETTDGKAVRDTLTINGEVKEVQAYGVIFIECKLERNIDKIEKEKVEWIKSNLHIPVLLARKGEKRGTVKYEEI